MYKTTSQLIFIAGLFLISSCGDKKKEQAGPPPAVYVTIDTAEAITAPYYDEYPGIVTALNQTDIRSQVTGYVTAMYFKDGDKVVKGQKLYSIDQQLYNANYQQALANLAVQQTNMMKAEKDAERYHELDRQDAIAKQQVDYADAAYEAAKKQVDAAKASANAVRANVSFATITAPFTGTIGISAVRTGTSVIAGSTILNTISTDNPIAVDFAVDQREVFRFGNLQSKARPGDSTFRLVFDKEIYPFSGSVGFMDRAVDPQTGSIKTRLVFPNDKNMLRAGMSTTVRVLSNNEEKSVVIPYKAVTEQLGEFFAYVVGDSNKVTQKRVMLGKQIGVFVIIKDGVKEGDKIVTQGVQNLREGAVITTTPPQPQAQKK